MNFNDTLNKNLDEFANYESQFPGPIPDSVHFDFGKSKGHVVFGSIVHGNEVGSLPAINNVISKLAKGKIKFGGKVTFFLGNKKASLQNKRFTEYDLNRSFGLEAKGNNSYERKRALEIMKILDLADVFIDFHQTNRPSSNPFYIFSMDKESFYWAQAAGVGKFFVTRKPGSQFSDAGMCSDEYVRSLKKAGLTLELGEKGFNSFATANTTTVILRTLKNAEMVFNEVTSIEKRIQKNNPFHFFVTIYQEPIENNLKILNKGFCNFDFIKKDQVIGKNGDGSSLISPKEGYILFPKYPVIAENEINPPPTKGDLYVLVNKLKFHPLKWV